MTETERVNVAWERIEKWYSQNMPDVEIPAGATEADIQALETHLNLTLPEGLKASLLRHDGFSSGLWPKEFLNSLYRIKFGWDSWNEWLDENEDEMEVQDTGEKLQSVFWSPSWIPFDGDEGGSGACVDLKPGKNGKIGQVIFMDNVEGPSGPLFEDYPAYLEDIALQLEAGKYMLNADGCIVEAE